MEANLSGPPLVELSQTFAKETPVFSCLPCLMQELVSLFKENLRGKKSNAERRELDLVEGLSHVHQNNFEQCKVNNK